jgi:hypothetical protein
MLHLMRYEAFRNDCSDPEVRGSWFVNQYEPSESGKVMYRTTIADELTESEAMVVAGLLNRAAKIAEAAQVRVKV